MTWSQVSVINFALSTNEIIQKQNQICQIGKLIGYVVGKNGPTRQDEITRLKQSRERRASAKTSSRSRHCVAAPKKKETFRAKRGEDGRDSGGETDSAVDERFPVTNV